MYLSYSVSPLAHSPFPRYTFCMARKKSSIVPELTAKQAAYVDLRAKGVSRRSAATEAGFDIKHDGTIAALETSAAVALALEQAREAYKKAAKIERQDVVEGIKEAIEMARMLSDPQGMIAGWRELAKLCGLYAPEVKKIELSMSANRAKTKYEALSDEELFKIANGTVVDGEWTEEKVPKLRQDEGSAVVQASD